MRDNENHSMEMVIFSKYVSSIYSKKSFENVHFGITHFMTIYLNPLLSEVCSVNWIRRHITADFFKKHFAYF